MIDCHAHVFPDLEELLRASTTPDLVKPVSARLGRVAGRVARRAEDFTRAALEQAHPRLSRWRDRVPALSGQSLDLENLAFFRSLLPSPLRNALELAMSPALLPHILLHGGVEALFTSMDESGVERAVVIAAPRAASNEWLLDEVMRDPRAQMRFIPVAHVPTLGAEPDFAVWRDHFLALARRGARGFKIHPNMDGRHVDDVAYRALFAVAEETDRFVILHTGCFCVPSYKTLRHADPHAFVHHFRAHPSVRVCLAHMNRDEPEVCFGLLREFPQLYVDTSWQPASNIRRAVAELGTERILLGSDWPLLHAHLQRDAVQALHDGTSPDDIPRITVDNARRFLGEVGSTEAAPSSRSGPG